MKHLIYMIRNTVNGKVYIGQTRQGLARRRGEHVARFNLGERDHKLYQAMRKHGLAAFEFSVVCHVLKAEYLNELEVVVIAQNNSFKRGYNMTCGGDSVSDETRAKISVALTGRSMTWGAKVSATRLAMGIKMAGRVPEGAANPNASSYIIRDPEGVEHSVTGLRAFCKPRGLDHKTMLDTLKGVQRHHKGYSVLSRFNGQSDSSYPQARGNGAYPAALAG